MGDPSNPAADGQPYFQDGAQLSNQLLDRRSQDTIQKSTFSDATNLANSLAAQSAASAWPTLTRSTVAQRITQLVSVGPPNTPPDLPPDITATGPRCIRQASLNLCGPAAFFEMAFWRDPVALTQFSSDLFNNGSATIGSLQVSPSQGLLQADFNAMLQKATNPFEQADWMLLGALRNSTDVFWQGSWQGDPAQMVAALTRPEELAGWMRSSGIWSTVDDHGKWASNPGIVAASDIKLDDGTDVALLIHVNLIASSKIYDPASGNPWPDDDPRQKPGVNQDNTFLLRSFPDHWVVLLSEIVPDAAGQNVRLNIWSWGQRYYLYVPNQVFLDNYYGAVIAHMAAPPSQGGSING